MDRGTAADMAFSCSDPEVCFNNSSLGLPYAEASNAQRGLAAARSTSTLAKRPFAAAPSLMAVAAFLAGHMHAAEVNLGLCATMIPSAPFGGAGVRDRRARVPRLWSPCPPPTGYLNSRRNPTHLLLYSNRLSLIKFQCQLLSCMQGPSIRGLVRLQTSREPLPVLPAFNSNLQTFHNLKID